MKIFVLRLSEMAVLKQPVKALLLPLTLKLLFILMNLTLFLPILLVLMGRRRTRHFMVTVLILIIVRLQLWFSSLGRPLGLSRVKGMCYVVILGVWSRSSTYHIPGRDCHLPVIAEVVVAPSARYG